MLWKKDIEKDQPSMMTSATNVYIRTNVSCSLDPGKENTVYLKIHNCTYPILSAVDLFPDASLRGDINSTVLAITGGVSSFSWLFVPIAPLHSETISDEYGPPRIQQNNRCNRL